MDETTDDCSRSVVNTLFSFRQNTKLVSVDFLNRVNNSTMGGTLLSILPNYNISYSLPKLFLTDSASYMKKCYREALKPIMPQLIHIPCCAHIINLIGDTWRIFPSFDLVKTLLAKIKETFVNAPARKGRYLTHLRMHGIENPCKIPLPNATRWNSWFRMVFYTKDHIEYWPSFYYEEYERDRSHNSISTINEILQNTEKKAFIIIYINFIACYAREFVQDLDFFQQQNKPVFPFVEGRLEQLTSYLEGNRAAEYFGSDLQSLITQYNYNPNDFYIIFRAAFDSAYNKFKVHIPQHPARSLFRASRVFDPLFLKIGIQTGDTSCSDIRRYSAIMELSNPSDELLREWAIYCGSVKNLIIDQINLDLYWTEMQATLPILSNIALDCIWFPISSCSVERSFSTYNNLLSSDRQNLSRESLKQLNMLYFNGDKF
ncbi:hypothetical protein Glove_69g55 [Diversispora epigaea]|uniref:HAT C-terminal dimerisation domain-containing protein n=2 Tax=Diversispora epigaea TaxID=1348612 RepID=A0A397JEJ6_9GLOM|nr:hypothetical protein Glove_69g55 [Diversispora epigaea]